MSLNKKKIYCISVASVITATLAMLITVSSLNSIHAVDTYVLIQIIAMFSAFWVPTYIDYETHKIKTINIPIRTQKIPQSYFLFVSIGMISVYFINGIKSDMVIICIFYLTLYPLLVYKNEYYVISLMSENNLITMYSSRIIKQLFPAALAIFTGSVAYTLAGSLLGLLVSSLYIQVNLKHKINWAYRHSFRIENSPNEFKLYRLGLSISAGLAAMWYFERLSLSSIEPGLLSIAYYSSQITSTIATVLAGTFASLQFNKSENSLGELKKYSLTIFSLNLVLMGLVYLFIKEMNVLLGSILVDNELISLFRKNIDFFAIYSLASIPVTTALFIGRMYVASGKSVKMMKFYIATLPVHFGFIGMGLITQNTELLAMHFFMGNLLYCALSLFHNNFQK